MNKLHPSERWIRLLAFSLSLLLYGVAVNVIWFWADRLSDDRSALISLSAVHLSFAQMELTAVEEIPPPKEPEPSPKKEPEPPPPEEVDVVLEEIIEEPEPDVSSEALVKEERVETDMARRNEMEEVAQVTQEAAAPEVVANPDALRAWVQQQIEREKYYPVTARRAGYEGSFNLLVKVEADGAISEAVVLSGRGHPLLRRSLEKIMELLIGRNSGRSLEKAVELPFEFNFELQ